MLLKIAIMRSYYLEWKRDESLLYNMKYADNKKPDKLLKLSGFLELVPRRGLEPPRAKAH